MSIKLKNLDKWLPLASGEVVTLGGGDPSDSRKVRLEVNAPYEVRLYIGINEEQRFLALVKGLETVEFFVRGQVDIHSDGDVALYTAEFETVSFYVPEATTFTKIAERRHRNPELEYVMHRMTENMERRMAIRDREVENLRAAMEAQQNVRAAETHVSDGKAARKPDEPAAGAGEAGGEGEPAVAAGATSE